MDNVSLTEKITRHYDKMIQTRDRYLSHFDKIGFMNVGYWKGIHTNNIEMAQINLIEHLIRFLHNVDGNVLDVACGKGASTKFLTKYFAPDGITGINVSPHQLETCKVVAPECNFKLMDATKLDFAASSLDNILCIEAAFHFLTRQKFFEEARRVLKPSGRMAMFDVLFDYDVLKDLFPGEHDGLAPRENYLPGLEAYRERLVETGFSYVHIEDCTELTSRAACSYVVAREEREFGRTQDPKALDLIRWVNVAYHRATLKSCMVYAIK